MDDTLQNAHGTVMILAWTIFGTTGVLLSRYGRTLRFGNQRQLLGKSIWFQIHRFLLSISSLLTLAGFLLIFVCRRSQLIDWSMDSTQLVVHSILGSVVVCCVILQIWLALYRCHPRSRFRFIFNWSHRIIGSLSLAFALTNLFLITFASDNQQIPLIIIVSLWTGWVIIVVILFELIQYQYRKAASLIALNARINNANQQVVNRNLVQDTEVDTNPAVDNQRLNLVKLILFLIHTLISVVFCILLIVINWNET